MNVGKRTERLKWSSISAKWSDPIEWSSKTEEELCNIYNSVLWCQCVPSRACVCLSFWRDSAPGAIVGSMLAGKLPSQKVRFALCLALVAIGAQLSWKSLSDYRVAAATVQAGKK